MSCPERQIQEMIQTVCSSLIAYASDYLEQQEIREAVERKNRRLTVKQPQRLECPVCHSSLLRASLDSHHYGVEDGHVYIVLECAMNTRHRGLAFVVDLTPEFERHADAGASAGAVEEGV